MAHLRARIQSKGGEATRLGNKRDGMRVEINGNGWRLEVAVFHSESTNTDHIHIAQIDQQSKAVVGDIIRMAFPVKEGER